MENRWVFGIDDEDRSGFYIGRMLRPIELSSDVTLELEPQFMLQRAITRDNSSYVAPGTSIDSAKVTQENSLGDLFGLEAELSAEVMGWTAKAEADISTLNPSNFLNGSRFWGDVTRFVDLPLLGEVEARLFGAYRYRTWNGSLGETDVYSALGCSASRKAIGTGATSAMTTSGVWASATIRPKASRQPTRATIRSSTPCGEFLRVDEQQLSTLARQACSTHPGSGLSLLAGGDRSWPHLPHQYQHHHGGLR